MPANIKHEFQMSRSEALEDGNKSASGNRKCIGFAWNQAILTNNEVN